jgi:hypothetical protein
MTSQESKARGLHGKLPPLEALPAIRTTVDVVITDVTADGDVRYELAYKQAEIVEGKPVKAGATRQATAAVGAFVGLKGHAIITSRGITKEIEIEPPPNATPETLQALEAARAVVSQIVEPLPDEAVGIGAKWQTSSTVTAGEITAQSTATYELVELADMRAKVKITLTVHGKGSGSGNLTVDTTGRGEKSLDLTSVIPSQARLDLRTEVGLDADRQRLAQVGMTKVTLVGN